MYRVGLYKRVRQSYYRDGKSVRELSRVFGLHRDTIRKMLQFSVPPGYRRKDPPKKPKLDPFTGVIDAILVLLINARAARRANGVSRSRLS